MLSARPFYAFARLLSLVALFSPAVAQVPGSAPTSRFHAEIGGGFFTDPYDAGRDIEGGGPLGMVRLGYAARPGLRLTLAAASAASYDITASSSAPSRPGPPLPEFDARWTLMTLGAEKALGAGATGFLVGLEGGVAFRSISSRSRDVAVTGGVDGAAFTAGYRVGLRHRLSPRFDAVLAVRDALLHVTDGFNSRSLGATLSIVIR